MNKKKWFIIISLSFILCSCASKNQKETLLKNNRKQVFQKSLSQTSAKNPNSIRKKDLIEENIQKMYPFLSNQSLPKKDEIKKETPTQWGKKEKKQTKKEEKKSPQRPQTIQNKTNLANQAPKKKTDKKTELEKLEQERRAEQERRKLIEKRKKALQSILENLDSKINVLFLPLLHYENHKLKKQVTSIYKEAINEVKKAHPSIILKDSSLVEKSLLQKNKTLKLGVVKNKKGNQSYTNQKSLEVVSEYISSVPPYLKKFFNFNEEEYDLKSISSALRRSEVDALVEGKIFEYDIEPVEKKGFSFYAPAKIKGVCELRIRLMAHESERIIWEDRKVVTTIDKKRNYFALSRERTFEKHSDLSQRIFWESLSKIFPPFIKAIKKLSWNGKVAFVSQDRIYINAGQNSGIEIGDFMQVRKNGIEIFDPETGNFIGKAPGEIKGIIKVIKHFGKDGSIAVINKGDFSKIKANDEVKIF